jgi:hypothetical protein
MRSWSWYGWQLATLAALVAFFCFLLLVVTP